MKRPSTFSGATLAATFAVLLAVGPGARAQTQTQTQQTQTQAQDQDQPLPQAQAQRGNNPFVRVIKQDDAAGVRSLLAKGADPNIKDEHGQPGIVMALHEGSFRAARALADAPQLRVDLTNDADETALMMAAYTGQMDIAKTLIANGAMINKPGWSPLHYAASKGQLDMIRYLLARGADIEAQSPNGTTPLMMAAAYGTPEAVTLLLQSGADIGTCNQLDLTALDFAHQYQRPDAIKILTQAEQQKAGAARACPAPEQTPPPSQ
jgi:ankyrin repeat protein